MIRAVEPRPGTTAGIASAVRAVPPQKTPVDPAQIRAAIGRAYQRETGKAPDQRVIDTLTAHVSHETASGSMMHNYNFGGIKGHSPEGLTANTKTKEVLGGREVSIVDGFRAYSSVDAGASDYVRTMSHRFPAAMQAAGRGDVAGFAHALKKANYYTADEQLYANALQRHMGAQTHGPPVAKTAASPPDQASPFLGTAGLGRIADALASPTSRILAPVEDDS
jgi:hypothetical protein